MQFRDVTNRRANIRPLTLVLLCSTLATPAIAQTTIYVDAANPRCPGAGTKANPFCTVQAGIDAAPSAATVLVLPGTYRENLDFRKKAINVSICSCCTSSRSGRSRQRALLVSRFPCPAT